MESFNFMLGDGLKLAVADLEPVEFLVPETNDRVSLWITNANLAKPSVAAGSVGATNSKVRCLSFLSPFYVTDNCKGVSNGGKTAGWFLQRVTNSTNGILHKRN